MTTDDEPSTPHSEDSPGPETPLGWSDVKLPASVANACEAHAVVTLGQAAAFLADIACDDIAALALGVPIEDRDRAIADLAGVVPLEETKASPYAAIPSGMPIDGDAPTSAGDGGETE